MMSEYRDEKARQMAREFKLGISILAVLFCVFVGVAYRHYRKSFVDPPSKFASHPKPPHDQLTDASQASILAWPAPDPPPTARFVPPPYEEVNDDLVQRVPMAPPRPEDDVQLARAEGTAYEKTGGGSFRRPEAHGQTDVAVEPSSPDRFPADRPFPAAPSADVSDDPDLGLPPPVDPSPSALIDPATFEQESLRPAQVRRTEFQREDAAESGFSLTLPDLRPQALASPPQAFQIDGPTKPIDQATRVEPIRADDSFWLISQRAYGNGGYFRALYEHNRQQFPEPDQLPVGASVEIPAADFLRHHYAEFCPHSEAKPDRGTRASDDDDRGYTVVGGESLFDVARFQMGQASRYVEILKLNREVLGDRIENLPAGLRLRLPTR